jgi:parvulin-like peptidyl-prolyl isomerase
MMSRWCLSLLIPMFVLSAVARGQADVARAEMIAVSALKPPGTIVAHVAGKDIDVAAVNRLVKVALHGRPVSKAALPGLEAQALVQVINRRLVELYLDNQKISVTEAEVDKALAEREKELRKQETDLAVIRAESGFTTATYRDEVKWELRRTKFLRGVLTDEQLEKYFEAHRQQFDGTELRVSHILLRPDGALTPDEVDSLSARADSIRDEIIGELTTFEDAAKKYSSGPSREKGGDLGFMTRHGVMPEDFAKAAFALNKDEISPPVATHLGVHLIKCTELRPGKNTWRDVRKELQPAATNSVFAQLAAGMREKTQIEYTGAIAHIDPETGDLVEAADATADKEGADKDSSAESK